jgi:hypothetical protein
MLFLMMRAEVFNAGMMNSRVVYRITKKKEYLVEHLLVCVRQLLLYRKFGLLKLMKNYVRTLGLLWKDLEIKMEVHVKQK